MAAARVVEGPKNRAYSFAAKDADGMSYTLDLSAEFAKVTYTHEGKEIARWTPTKVQATVVSNDAFEISAKCEENLTAVLNTLGPSDDTMLFCQIFGRRPNSKGAEERDRGRSARERHRER